MVWFIQHRYTGAKQNQFTKSNCTANLPLGQRSRRTCACTITSLVPRLSFLNLCCGSWSWRAWYAKLPEVTSNPVSVGVSKETPSLCIRHHDSSLKRPRSIHMANAWRESSTRVVALRVSSMSPTTASRS